MHKYIKSGEKLGEGGFGTVIKAHVRNDNGTLGRAVAIKKLFVKNRQLGLDISTIRELKILRELDHPNIVECLDIFVNDASVYLVMECCIASLQDVIKSSEKEIPDSHIKSILKQILQSVLYLHENWILHRDIKPGNFLISEDGTLKLTDFGTARSFGINDEIMEPDVCTIWYRAPEMLFGAERYTGTVDMWAVGCTFAELLMRRPLFAGKSEIEMIKFISTCIGTPSEKNWAGVSKLPCYVEFTDFPGTKLSEFIYAPREALDLLSKMLTLDPTKRITAADALKHEYFANLPKLSSSELKIYKNYSTPDPNNNKDNNQRTNDQKKSRFINSGIVQKLRWD